MEVIKVTKENIENIRKIYNDFTNIAQRDFLFELPPINFDDLKANFIGNFVKIYISQDTIINGFLLYSDNLTQGIELTLIYATDNNLEIKKNLLQKFLDDCKKQYQEKVISYPMLGIQNDFSQTAKDMGFSTIDEQILELKINEYNEQNITLPDNYKITQWQNSFINEAINIIFEEFSKSNDAKFDPRFQTIFGTKNIIECITNSDYGTFLPQETSVIMYNNKPVGFCFVNLTTPNIANVPLLAIAKEHQKQGLGTIIIKNSLNKIKKNLSQTIPTINTTCDTNNIPAKKSYENAGFYTKNAYKHAYLWI